MRILFVHKQILFPRDTGGKIRVLNVLRHLARQHEVTYLCTLRPDEQDYREKMEALGVRLETVPARESRRGSWRFYADLARNVFSSYPFPISRNYEPALRDRAATLLREDSYDLVICDTVVMARHTMGLAGAAQLLFQHNVEAQIWRRHAELNHGWFRRRYMAVQAERMRRFEETSGRRFDAVIAVSEPDRQLFERQYGWTHVDAIDTAVDVDYFQPRPGVAQPGRVLFVGSMDWLPNQDGVAFFVERAWPLIRQAQPRATFQIVGRNPPPSVRRLERIEGVEVVGTVPDVRPYLAEAEVVVVPLLVGGGTRIKIFEAMAMGKAVVSTTIGAEGLSVTSGEHIRLADQPHELADAVVELLVNSDRRAKLGEAGRRLVNEQFSTDMVAAQFEKLCHKAVERRPIQKSLLPCEA